MIDTLNLRLSSVDAPGVRFMDEVAPHLEDVSEHFWGNGSVSIVGRLGTLKLTVSEMGVSVKDRSFAKWILGNNVSVLRRHDIEDGITKLSDSLHVDMGKSIVTRVDIAQNIIVNHKPEVYFNYLGVLPRFKRLEMKGGKGNGLYYGRVGVQLAFYDKIAEQKEQRNEVPEMYQGKNLLRYELRIKRNVSRFFRKESVIASDLYNVSFYQKLATQWLLYYGKIDKVNNVVPNFRTIMNKRELYKVALLHYIEDNGGKVEYLNKIAEASKLGEITPKQAHDLKQAVNNAYEADGDDVRKSEEIEELTTKVTRSVKFFR